MLCTTRKADVDQAAWESSCSAVPWTFDRPQNGRIAAKVINYLEGDVMKLFGMGIYADS